MKVLLDTSVLLAALLKHHPRHAEAVPWLQAAVEQRLSAVVSGHSLAELYATLSSLPSRPRLTPAQAAKLVEVSVLPHVSVHALSPQDYADLVSRMGVESLAGGIVYDAIHAEVALIAGADTIVTLNPGDFVRVCVASAIQVVSPTSVPAP